MSDSEQIGGPLAGPSDDDQADAPGGSAAVADGAPDDAAAAQDAQAQNGEAQGERRGTARRRTARLARLNPRKSIR